MLILATEGLTRAWHLYGAAASERSKRTPAKSRIWSDLAGQRQTATSQRFRWSVTVYRVWQVKDSNLR
ncbi:MAG: hypothetical protein ABIO16_05565, partial [Nocardioides sp.]